MRRILSIFLVICTLVALSGCGSSAPAETNAPTLPSNIMQKSDPTEDDTLNILMIGNSFCYYYVEELYGMLTAAGYENVNVCNIYSSGCPLNQHWSWWTTGKANYEYYETNATGRNKKSDMSLEDCLKLRNWDIISLQEKTALIYDTKSAADHVTQIKSYFPALLGYIREQYPLSRYLWHQTWANQIGEYNGTKITSLAEQDSINEAGKQFALAICQEYGFERVNSGDAWQIIRKGGYDNLCARLNVNNNKGDNAHEGDIGGGQYLNACVWFEVITGQSCVGNAYRPDYKLDSTLIPKLQQAAHEAVASR